MGTKYVYTKDLSPSDTLADVGNITINDIVFLNGKNIIKSIAEGNIYEGINPIPSFDLVKDVSSTASAAIIEIKENYLNLSTDSTVTGENTFEKPQIFDTGLSASDIRMTSGSGYSLSAKIASIETSASANADDIESAQLSIADIDLTISSASCDYNLTSSNSTSVITAVKQENGKLELKAKQLMSADIGNLNALVTDVKDVALKADTEYLPLSGGTITGNIEFTKKITLDDARGISNIVIGDNNLCTLLGEYIGNTASDACDALSASLSGSLDFKYDYANNELILSIAGKSISVNTSAFTEARLLQSTSIKANESDKKFLILKFKTGVDSETFQELSIALDDLVQVYNSGEGITITTADSETKGYTVKIDKSVVATKDDLKAISASNSLKSGDTGYSLLTNLCQNVGKISYTTVDLSTNCVKGLEEYDSISSIAVTLSNNISVNPDGFVETTHTGAKINGSLSVTDDISASGSLMAAGGIVDISNGNCGAIALGCSAKAEHERTFVWNGVNTPYSDKTSFYSPDAPGGTFNINPQDGRFGFFVGDESLGGIVNSTSAELYGLIDSKIYAMFNGIYNAINNAKINKDTSIENITLGNVISCIYGLKEFVYQFKDLIGYRTASDYKKAAEKFGIDVVIDN